VQSAPTTDIASITLFYVHNNELRLLVQTIKNKVSPLLLLLLYVYYLAERASSFAACLQMQIADSELDAESKRCWMSVYVCFRTVVSVPPPKLINNRTPELPAFCVLPPSLKVCEPI
jgi:hypothetical protein